jgi:UDP-N-acetylglucosamine/UDP-N-acetylgalactosamine diphosphorylase
MQQVPTDLARRLHNHRQEHLLTGWDTLSESARVQLVSQLAGIDFGQMERLYQGKDSAGGLPDWDEISPIEPESEMHISSADVELGHRALAQGELAVLLVAGGQGTRLGFDKPKGMFPIGPISQKTLFQIHADKIYALSRRYGQPIPFLIMTSPATQNETEAYFQEQNYFGLGKENIYFFQQGTMPALDIETGQLLLEKPGVIFTSPNGHGGTLMALAENGLLQEMKQRGVKTLFYFQVDNPLVKIGDPIFLGRHLAVQSEASSKAIAKVHAKEKMGVLAKIKGRCGIIEYSDLPEELAHASDTHGRLTYRAGSPAIHLFDLDFLERITEQTNALPYHVARKRVPYYSPEGFFVQPSVENAFKFEMFIFDALPLAERFLVMEAIREEEFAPVKNASGPDSPAVTREMMSNLAASWLEKIGSEVPRESDGTLSFPIEISARFALDFKELACRLHAPRRIIKPLYLD